MIVPVIPFAAVFVLFVLFYYISAWQRPSQLPSISAEPVRRSGSFLTRAYHWATTNFYNYAGPGLITKLIKGPGLDLLKYIERVTQATLSTALASHLYVAVKWLRATEALARDAALQTGYLAEQTHNALSYLRHTTVPRLISTAVAPVRALAVQAHSLATDAEGRLDTFRDALLGALAAAGIGTFSTMQAGIRAFVHAYDALHAKVWQDVVPKLEQAITVTIPGLVGGVNDLEREVFENIPGTLGALREWANDLANFAQKALRDPLAWVIGLLGSAAGVLALEGVLAAVAPNLFCNNTKGVTKKLCALDEGLIAALLAGSLGLLVALDVKQIAREAQDGVGAIDGIIRQMAGV